MDVVLSVCIGIALAATCGFRVFVPLLALSIAGLSGVVDLGSSFQWVGTYQAVIVFGVAALMEILAYFIPYVDNVLDAASMPFSVLAGIIVTAAVMTDVSPVVQWTMAIVAGGSVAAAGSLVSNGVHAASTLASGGAANPAVSTVESTGSIVASVLAVAVPILAVVLIAIAVIVVYRYFIRARRRGGTAAQNSEAGP